GRRADRTARRTGSIPPRHRPWPPCSAASARAWLQPCVRHSRAAVPGSPGRTPNVPFCPPLGRIGRSEGARLPKSFAAECGGAEGLGWVVATVCLRSETRWRDGQLWPGLAACSAMTTSKACCHVGEKRRAVSALGSVTSLRCVCGAATLFRHL